MGPSSKSSLVARATLVVAAVVVGMATPVHARSETGMGTGTSTVRAASVSIDGVEDVVVHLLDLQSSATLDKERQKSASNHAEGVLKAAVVDLGPAATEFFPRELGTLRVFRDEGTPGADRRGQNLAVALNIPGDISAADLGATNTDVAGLLTDIDAARTVSVANGLVAKGSVRPLDLEALFTASGASFSGGSTVDSLEALGGLIKVSGLAVADQKSSAAPDLAQGGVRELAVDSIKVLGLNELLGMLGLDKGEIPLATLAAMADSLGLPVSGTLGTIPTTDLGSTWTTATQVLATSRADLEASLGGACGALPGELNGLLGQVGVSCSGTVQQALDAVNGVIDLLLPVVENAVFDASLVSVGGLVASVEAAANVTEEGIAQTSAAAAGAIEELRIGGVDVGSITASLTESPLATLQRQWDAVGDAANLKLDQVLGNLGDPYRGLVSVIPVPVGVQSTKIDGDYAVADAALSLLQVKITLPSQLPNPQDLISLLPATPVTTTTVPTAPVTVPTLPAVTIPTVPTVTVPTLPISNVRSVAGPGSVRGQAIPLGSATIDVGVLSAHADHTRPGVGITGGGDNRTWNARTGFGDPGSLPRTGGSGPAVAIFAVLVVTAFGFNRLTRSARRTIG